MPPLIHIILRQLQFKDGEKLASTHDNTGQKIPTTGLGTWFGQEFNLQEHTHLVKIMAARYSETIY